MPLPSDTPSLAAENQALRAENQLLHAALAKAATDVENQVRFRALFDHSPRGYYVLDAGLTIRQANAAGAALLGLESSLELLGHAMLEYAHPDHYPDWGRMQAALWEQHSPTNTLETCLLRADGSLLWCRVSCALFPDGGNELGYTTLEDISDRKELEHQMLQQALALQAANENLAAFNEELQIANEELLETNTTLGHVNEELDTFVYAASHDLRTPISNMQGLVQALARALPAEARQVAMVERVLGMMAQSMALFTRTLDRLADFGATQVPGLGREHVDLATVLEEVRQELGPLLAATQGQLVVELAGKPAPWFATKHVHSVLLNLVSNALKYHHPDRAPVVRVSAHYGPGRSVVVRVQDNGLGLTEKQQGQLFRMFKRLHMHVEGTGIGLYLVRKILTSAGGSIQVQSTTGLGSTFTVLFPG